MRIALTIAGSDPSGGAGIQADLKTFMRFGIHGLSAITSIAIQNSSGVKRVADLKGYLLEEQLEVLFSDFSVNAVKTGMLYSKENILTVERALVKNNVAQYIIDPIIISSSGFPLIVPDGISLMKERLFPLATLVTPNLKEAEALSGLSISNEEDLQTAAEKICSQGPKAVLIKGLIVGRERIVDLLYSDKGAFRFESEWLEGRNIHGAGCILSAAIAGSLASGKEVRDAVEIARSYILERIRSPLGPGKGEGFLYLT